MPSMPEIDSPEGGHPSTSGQVTHISLELRREKSEEMQQQTAKPWFVYPVLAAAIVSVSSAAVTFTSMSEISPFLLASWRLQLTAALLIPAGAFDFWQMNAENRRRLLRDAPLMLSSGLLLGSHFGAWVVCIEHTSLTHALLVGSSPPIIIAVGTWIMRKPISRGELLGTGMAASGCILIAQSAGNEKMVSLFGDCIGLLAACFFVLYLTIGHRFRNWMPIFGYVLPVNALAALFLCCAAIATEGARISTQPDGLFGYMGSWHYLWRTVYLGAVPGIAGHVSFNALLKWLHPLLIALPGTTEPLIGSLIGLALGVGTLPGLFTYLGGSILLGATVLVIICSYRREQAEVQGGAEKGVIMMASKSPQAEDAAEKGQTSSHCTEEDALLSAPTRQ